MAAAFELIDDREADYNNMNAFELIADNAWNGGVVAGPEIADWQALDLVGARGSLEIDGKPVGEGRGGDAMGHPFEPLAWLANNAIARGPPLRGRQPRGLYPRGTGHGGAGDHVRPVSRTRVR